MYVITVFLASLVCLVAARESDFCHASDNNPYLYFGTKTAYKITHGNLKSEKNCKPIQIFVVARHGTRYPGKEQIPGMKALPELRDRIVRGERMSHLCDSDLQKLKDWKLDGNVTEKMADELAPQGNTELKELALRLKTEFSELLKLTNNSNLNSDFVFRSTDTNRTKFSMAAFMEGLLGSRNATTPIKAPSTKNDTLLLSKKNCQAWINDTNTQKFLTEKRNFTSGLEMTTLVYNVSRRLGLNESLTLENVITIYDMCRFEKAWRLDEVSAWCAAFSKEELKILEYRDDLDFYYYAGPGREINARVGCPPMKDMFEHFQKLEGDDYSKEPKGIFYFSHSATLTTLNTAFGFSNNSQPILASNYKTMADRKYRTSLIGQFANNFIGVFYKCTDPNNKTAKAENKVAFHWAEKVVEYEGCKAGLCGWDHVKNKLGEKVKNCTVEFCNGKSGASRLFNFNIVHLIISLFTLIGFHKTF